MSDLTPKSLSELKETIKREHPNLSKRLRQVAEFVIDSPSDVAFGTVAVLSEQAGVHPSTWVRFANSFGFSGFTEMQKLFQQNLMEESPNYQDRIRMARDALGTNDSDQSPYRLLKRFSDANVLALQHLAEIISTEELEQNNQIMVKQLKNRYNDPTSYQRFTLKVDRSKMRLSDDDDPDEQINNDDTPVFDNSNAGERFKNFKME